LSDTFFGTCFILLFLFFYTIILDRFWPKGHLANFLMQKLYLNFLVLLLSFRLRSYNTKYCEI